MGRHLEEHLWVRAPTLYRRLVKLLRMLPPGSPLRRRFLKLAVARGLEALTRGDDEVVLLSLDRDVEFNIIGEATVLLGFAETYRGHEGWLEFIKIWRVEWAGGQITHTPEALIDLGDPIIVRTTLTAQGATSRADVALTGGLVCWIRDGVIVRQDNYWEWSECVEALGLDDGARG
jgi:ketosteroid isomerase-like protein